MMFQELRMRSCTCNNSCLSFFPPWTQIIFLANTLLYSERLQSVLQMITFLLRFHQHVMENRFSPVTRVKTWVLLPVCILKHDLKLTFFSCISGGCDPRAFTTERVSKMRIGAHYHWHHTHSLQKGENKTNQHVFSPLTVTVLTGVNQYELQKRWCIVGWPCLRYCVLLKICCIHYQLVLRSAHMLCFSGHAPEISGTRMSVRAGEHWTPHHSVMAPKVNRLMVWGRQTGPFSSLHTSTSHISVIKCIPSETAAVLLCQQECPDSPRGGHGLPGRPSGSASVANSNMLMVEQHKRFGSCDAEPNIRWHQWVSREVLTETDWEAEGACRCHKHRLLSVILTNGCWERRMNGPIAA